MTDILCHTARFNLSRPGPDFINPCCFGEDFSTWLVQALIDHGVDADLICMEDFGWANTATLGEATYLMCVGGNSAEDPARPDYGEWRVMLERHRTLWDRIRGRNKDAATDPIVGIIVRVLEEAGFERVRVEG